MFLFHHMNFSVVVYLYVLFWYVVLDFFLINYHFFITTYWTVWLTSVSNAYIVIIRAIIPKLILVGHFSLYS